MLAFKKKKKKKIFENPSRPLEQNRENGRVLGEMEWL